MSKNYEFSEIISRRVREKLIDLHLEDIIDINDCRCPIFKSIEEIEASLIKIYAANILSSIVGPISNIFTKCKLSIRIFGYSKSPKAKVLKIVLLYTYANSDNLEVTHTIVYLSKDEGVTWITQ